jgi:methionyl-tRNA formyltransferase
LPQAVLDAPKYGCLNIHGSILPRWRGASPIQHAVWQGDAATGITIMQMDAGLDTGPMIVTETIPITEQSTSRSLYAELGAIGARLIVQVVDQLARDGQVERMPQPDAGVTYAPMLKKEDGQINWQKTAHEISCQIRALNPWPGTTAKLPGGEVIKVFSANVLSATTAAMPGTAINRDGGIACGGGTVLQVTAVQSPSGKKMDFAALINGGYITVGQCFAP